MNGGHHLYNPTEMEKFCEMHAPGLFNEVYTSILNESKVMPRAKWRELQRVRTVALMYSFSFYRNQVLDTCSLTAL